MVNIKEAADILSNQLKNLVVPVSGCSYNNCWLISTRPQDESADQNYPDSLYIVRKSDGKVAPFSPTMDMEGFQKAIKTAKPL